MSKPSPLKGVCPIATAELLATVSLSSLSIKAGVSNYPRLGGKVYSAPHSFISSIPLKMGAVEENYPVVLNLGRVKSASDSIVSITPERLFGRHCAILGATGGGKSYTLARIIEQSIYETGKIILLDATGEHHGIAGPRVRHCHLGSPVEKAEGSDECAVPPTCFIESDFLALFQPSGKVQGPKLREAIRSLRTAILEPSLAPNGFIEKINQPKAKIEKAQLKKNISSKLDDPTQPFDVQKLGQQIEQECVWPTAFNDDTRWGKEDGNFAHCLSLVTRINGIFHSPAFSCVFNRPELPSLTDEIDDFLEDDDLDLLRICMSGVSYEFSAREILANAIGRHLLNHARKGDFREQPLVVMLDEAHNFLGRKIGTDDSAFELNAFDLIAKEGRKYGLNICLATQRPRDVPEAVLSQMGTLLVHRLTNDRDREIVERACGAIDRSASAFLPNLEPGEAAIIGVDFPIPLTVHIDRPENPPKSVGPDFQKTWSVRNLL